MGAQYMVWEYGVAVHMQESISMVRPGTFVRVLIVGLAAAAASSACRVQGDWRLLSVSPEPGDHVQLLAAISLSPDGLYAATETGAQRYAAMADSAQVERLQVIWDKVSLNLLDDLVDDEAVPVAWVDLVRDLAAGSGLDRLADRLRPFGLA